MPTTTSRRALATTLAAVAALAAGIVSCDAPSTPGPSAPAAPRASVSAAAGHQHGAADSPEVLRWIAGVRSATARFHRIEAAHAAGWDARITGCMEEPGVGGMGFHYGNPTLIDGTVEEFAPELLLYEPQKNGTLRLVGVEYIVPFSAWAGAEPPTLHGLSFHANDVFKLWVLHVWTFEHNPAGIFSDWNPRITCTFA